MTVVPTNDPGLSAAARQRLSETRRNAGATSLLRFARTYLPAHFRLPPSPMHKEIVALLEQATTQRGARIAIAAPRGHAKSTLATLAYVLWSICYGREPFILLISNTQAQASEALSQVKNELQSNGRLIEDFAEVCEEPGVYRGAPRWRKDDIITRSQARLSALGAGTTIRGRRHRHVRPSLIVLDDIENEDEVRSSEQRRHKADWFNRAVLKAGSADTNVVVVGTVLHYDSLLANLIDPRKSPGWEGRKYQAVRSYASNQDLWARWEAIYNHGDDYNSRCGPEAARSFFEAHRREMLADSSVLWPQLEDYYALMEMRIREGRFSFDSEKQNEPVNPEDCYVQESDLHFWDDEHDSIESLLAAIGEHGRMYGACDPSLGKLGRGADDTAIISLLRDDRTRVLYVVDADIRRRKPRKIIADIIQYNRLRQYTDFGMEANQFQEFLADELRRQSELASARLPVRNIRSTTDKLGRIQTLQPLVSSGILRFSRRHPKLLEQLRQFPHGAHDDGPDALEMAVGIARQLALPQGGRFSV